MKIYKHTGSGFYIGSLVIVIAENYEMAKWLIETELISIGLNGEQLNITEADIKEGVVYSENGDY